MYFEAIFRRLFVLNGSSNLTHKNHWRSTTVFQQFNNHYANEAITNFIFICNYFNEKFNSSVKWEIHFAEWNCLSESANIWKFDLINIRSICFLHTILVYFMFRKKMSFRKLLKFDLKIQMVLFFTIIVIKMNIESCSHLLYLL